MEGTLSCGDTYDQKLMTEKGERGKEAAGNPGDPEGPVPKHPFQGTEARGRS